MFRQVWIGGKVSASSSWTLDGFSFQFLNFEYIDLGFWFLGVKFDFQFLSVEYIGSAFGSWVRLSVPGVEYIVPGVEYIDFGYQFLGVQLSVPGVKYIGFDFQFLDVCYWFRLSVLGVCIDFGFQFQLSVLGHLILISAFSSYAFDLKVMAATSHWALDRFRLQYLLKLWVSAVISLGIEMFQLRYLWIWKSAPESQ
ncbi:unnamed protein product [Rhizophagus irregularis]|nr:unnamed protein product [Rhizophagus irregularis]